MTTSTQDSEFRRKINELQNEINKASKKVTYGDISCLPTSVIVGIIAPIVLWIGLYYSSPSFVKKKEGDTDVLDYKKLFFWTLGITVLVWIGIYSFVNFNGISSMICMSK